MERRIDRWSSWRNSGGARQLVMAWNWSGPSYSLSYQTLDAQHCLRRTFMNCRRFRIRRASGTHMSMQRWTKSTADCLCQSKLLDIDTSDIDWVCSRCVMWHAMRPLVDMSRGMLDFYQRSCSRQKSNLLSSEGCQVRAFCLSL